jgi:hypothetical protein
LILRFGGLKRRNDVDRAGIDFFGNLDDAVE